MNKKYPLIAVLLFVFAMGFTSCEEIEDVKNTIDDAQSLVALRNVSFSFDTITTDFSLPEKALSGESFEALYEDNKAVYGDPSNYTINLKTIYLADNTSSEAADAKFDGMVQDIVFNNIEDSSLEFNTPGFEIKKDDVQEVVSEGDINLETHRLAGLYIFRQMVDGNDLDTKLMNKLLYKLGSKEGTIDLPQLQKDIPTRASEDMKNFLQGLLDKGIFELEE